MLDTSAYSGFMRGEPGVRLALEQADEIHFSPVVFGELHAGFLRGSRRADNQRRLHAFLSSARVGVTQIDDETSLRYAEIFNYLRQNGFPIPTNDIWIAAGAMQHGLRLLTADAHYLRLPQVLVDFCPPASA